MDAGAGAWALAMVGGGVVLACEAAEKLADGRRGALCCCCAWSCSELYLEELRARVMPAGLGRMAGRRGDEPEPTPAFMMLGSCTLPGDPGWP
jgi:hypothetical protein